MEGCDGDPDLCPGRILDHAKDGMINFLGDCWGTVPSHINAVMKKCEGVAQCKVSEKPTNLVVQPSGLKPAFFGPVSGLQTGGERCSFQLIGDRSAAATTRALAWLCRVSRSSWRASWWAGRDAHDDVDVR